MNIPDLLNDLRKLSDIKKRDIETDYEILLKNTQLVSHPDYGNFVSDLMSNSTTYENKEILKLSIDLNR